MMEDMIKEAIKENLIALRQQLESINQNNEPLKETVSFIESLRSNILEVGFTEGQAGDVCLLVIDGLTFDTENSPYTIPKQLVMVEAINQGAVKEYCKMLKFYYDEFSKLYGFKDRQIFKLIKVLSDNNK